MPRHVVQNTTTTIRNRAPPERYKMLQFEQQHCSTLLTRVASVGTEAAAWCEMVSADAAAICGATSPSATASSSMLGCTTTRVNAWLAFDPNFR